MRVADQTSVPNAAEIVPAQATVVVVWKKTSVVSVVETDQSCAAIPHPVVVDVPPLSVQQRLYVKMVAPLPVVKVNARRKTIAKFVEVADVIKIKMNAATAKVIPMPVVHGATTVFPTKKLLLNLVKFNH